MTDTERIKRIRDDLVLAMHSGEVSPKGTELLQLAADLTVVLFPESTRTRNIDPFSLLVGSVMGAAVQKYESEE